LDPRVYYISKDKGNSTVLVKETCLTTEINAQLYILATLAEEASSIFLQSEVYLAKDWSWKEHCIS